jgi:hypothetical protein
VWRSQRTIQPGDCCGPIANLRESGIRARSQGTHAVPGQASTGSALGRHPHGTHPAAVVVGTTARAASSDGIAGRASDRHHAGQRWEETHPNAIPGRALARYPVRQPDAVPATQIGPILCAIIINNAFPTYDWRRG